MSAASAAACAIALSSAAAAQSAPAGCSPSPLAPGSTILCVSSEAIAGPLVADGVDDLTVVVGDADTATTLTSGEAGAAVALNGGGDQTLNVNAGSVVTGTDVGVYVGVTGGAGALTVNSAGTISGGSMGVQAYNAGAGVTNITTADVSGGSVGVGVTSAFNAAGAVNVDTSAGTVSGVGTGINVRNRGTGDVSITTADVSGVGGVGVAAINYYGEGSQAGITIDTTAGRVTGGFAGIIAQNEAGGSISITTADVQGEASGIRVLNDSNSAGGVTINTVAGTVSGGDTGVLVDNNGAGGVNITTANVSSDYTGIVVVNGPGSVGDVAIDTVAGTVSGGDVGILVDNRGAGGVSITTANVSGDYTGILVENGPNSEGDVVINTVAGAVTGWDDDGIQVDHAGRGDVVITTANVTGDDDGIQVNAGYYIFGESGEVFGGDVVINTVAGEVIGVNDEGIDVRNYGPGNVTITTANVTGGDHGIEVESGFRPYDSSAPVGGDVVINTVAGTVKGGDNGIDVRNEGLGGVTITTANVTGRDVGILVEAGAYSVVEGVPSAVGGDIVINTVAGKVEGEDVGIGVYNSGPGSVSITTADVTGGGYVGIGVESGSHFFGEDSRLVFGGDIAINTVAGRVEGEYIGIGARNEGLGGVTITTADVTGGAVGIQVESGSDFFSGGSPVAVGGDVAINTVAGTIEGEYAGIDVRNVGLGGVTITTADVTGNVGIQVRSGSYFYGETSSSSSVSGGDVAIDTVAGTVTGEYAGIRVSNVGLGGVTITTADVDSNGVGIQVQAGAYLFGESAAPATGGDIVINTVEGTVSAGRSGVAVQNRGAGGISITTADVSVTGVEYAEFSVMAPSNVYNGVGIAAVNMGSNGGIAIDSSAGTVNAATAGILAVNQGAGGISITTADVSAAGMALGEYSYSPFNGVGIFAMNVGSGSDLVIDSTAGTVTGGMAGIIAAGEGDISITTGDVTGGTVGVTASDVGFLGEGVGSRDITINTVAGTVVGGAAGVAVQKRGTGDISITTADVSATGFDFGGEGGGVGVPFNGVGIMAANDYGSEGGIQIDSRAGTVSGSDVGIYARNEGAGSLTIAAGNVTGGRVGIEATNGYFSEGALVITSAGTVRGDQTGILASASGGDISITANNVESTTGSAIEATIGWNYSVFTGGISIMALPIAATGDLVVNTNGTVVGGTSGVLLNNFGTGTTTLNNTGTLSATDGPAVLAFGAPATINNSGTINGFVTLTDGDDVFNNAGRFNAGVGTDFGAGNDVFNNSGTLAVTAQAVELAGLETLNNSGLVDLRNGQTGTVLTLPGDYVGSGNATVAFDVENGPSGPTADLLVITGAATGQTGIAVNVLGSAGNELGLENLVLVSTGAGSSASAFTIASGLEEQGFLRLGVRHDAAANNFVLAVGPSLAAHRTTLYAEGMRNLWYKSADSWSRHMASVRNTEVEPGTSYWISAVGEFSERANNRAVAFNDSIEIQDFGYDQDYFGAQMGVDLNGGTGFNFGVTGGYLSSTQKFNGSADRVTYNAVNIGAYAGFTSGIVFANVLAKYDRVWADARSVGGRFDQTLDGSVYGGRAEVGLTFGDAASGFYAEPAASISYVGSDLDRLVTEQGSVDFVEDEGLLGKFGGRVGYAGFAGTSLYLGANLVREFAGDDRVNLQTAGRTFALTNQSERNYAETMVGLNLSDPSGTASGVFELRYSDGGDRKGFGGSATINFKF